MTQEQADQLQKNITAAALTKKLRDEKLAAIKKRNEKLKAKHGQADKNR
jgi:hypothetical protein